MEQAHDEKEPISLVREIWPGFMMGNLMLCRAGVKVRGGQSYIRKDMAEQSTLYWTYVRRNRPHNDLSHGWGSNSQWATAFRRDYADDAGFYYNVDGKLDVLLPDTSSSPNSARSDLEPGERLELLTNRCFITSQKFHADRWRYDDTFVELHC